MRQIRSEAARASCYKASSDVAEMDMQECLWVGDAAGDHWELHLTSIYEGPSDHPGDDEVIDGNEAIDESHVIVWKLAFLSRKGERLQAWWDPVRHILGGVQLRGWNKSVIGALKRDLIKLGRRPLAGSP